MKAAKPTAIPSGYEISDSKAALGMNCNSVLKKMMDNENPQPIEMDIDLRKTEEEKEMRILTIFTKVATNRVSLVAEKIIRPSQTPFLPGRNIMEGAVIIHEMLHELHRKKLNGVIFKIDFEKAYDKASLQLGASGLSFYFVQGGNVGIKVNDQMCSYFQTKKGLRQGEPLSPIQFNLVVDMLAITIARVKEDGQIKGVVPHLIVPRRGVLKKLEYLNEQHKKKYRLVKWTILCQTKYQGDLGIQNLDTQNKGLMKVKDIFLEMGKFKLNDGSQIRFWQDRWMGNRTLKFEYPSLYYIQELQMFNYKRVKIHYTEALHRNGVFSLRSMYLSLVNNGIKVTQEIWHMKLPLKINFLCGVVLTKDNWEKRNWQGNKSCSFYSCNETIQHLFFNCHYAKFLWRAVHVYYGIPPPKNMIEMFSTWSKQRHKQNILLLTGAAALYWTLCLTTNEIVFDKCRPKTFLQVPFRGTYWLRLWAKLQQSDDLLEMIVQGCQSLEILAMILFRLPWMHRMEHVTGSGAQRKVAASQWLGHSRCTQWRRCSAAVA
ncbi:hypothetical protein U9M48_012421 [Paspalum notatum var. saurae]|uniref:Reverse transcriptase zinc-binding domain-containing protein n=1 Tax=Paspalum notatum var. saurae TaxID=547442 RepID=A0AAQ3WII7_PASNO